MYDVQQISEMEYKISLARSYGPKDILTKIALVLVKVFSWIWLIFTPIAWITTFLGGCLITITFGIFAFILSLIWFPFLGLLLGTSWLWLRAWYLRPILIIPGILIAAIAILYVMLAPDPEKAAKHAKLSIATEWPLSWYLLRPPDVQGQ